MKKIIIREPQVRIIKVTHNNVTKILTNEKEKLIIRVPEQGPMGPPGPAGSELGSSVIRTAGEAIGGHRMVYVASSGNVMYADCSQITHAHRVFGLTINAAVSGESVNVQLRGIVENSGWSWDLGKEIFLGENGLLTQTPPTAGYILWVGYPVSQTSMDIRIGQAIIL